MKIETFGITPEMKTWECLVQLSKWIGDAEEQLVATEQARDRAKERIGLRGDPSFEEDWSSWRQWDRASRDLREQVTKAMLLHTFFARVNNSISLYEDLVRWPRD